MFCLLIIVSSEEPQPSVNCSRANGFFAWPANISCQNFWDCREGVAYKQTCPVGVIFDPQLNTCATPDQVGMTTQDVLITYYFQVQQKRMHRRWEELSWFPMSTIFSRQVGLHFTILILREKKEIWPEERMIFWFFSKWKLRFYMSSYTYSDAKLYVLITDQSRNQKFLGLEL